MACVRPSRLVYQSAPDARCNSTHVSPSSSLILRNCPGSQHYKCVCVHPQIVVQVGNVSASLGDRLWATWFSSATQYARSTTPLAIIRVNVQVRVVSRSESLQELARGYALRRVAGCLQALLLAWCVLVHISLASRIAVVLPAVGRTDTRRALCHAECRARRQAVGHMGDGRRWAAGHTAALRRRRGRWPDHNAHVLAPCGKHMRRLAFSHQYMWALVPQVACSPAEWLHCCTG
jgi:hypothetical protein